MTNWLRKFGNFDWLTQTPSNIPKTPQQKIMELEQKVKLFEKQKTFLEHQLDFQTEKAIFFDMMINIAEKELKIPIRKKSLSEPLTPTEQSEKDR